MITLAVTIALGVTLVQSAVTLPERIVDIRVHGNHTTPDAEVVQLSGVAAGTPFGAETLDAMRKALDASGRFRQVEVRKRYASMSDPTAILIVIVVEERAGIAIDVPEPGPLRTLRAHTMWMPILKSEDGYGLTYGARLSLVDVLGRRTRLSAPLVSCSRSKVFPSVVRVTGA